MKDKDPIGQIEAIIELSQNFNTKDSYYSIWNVITNKEFFFTVRIEAIKGLT